MKDNRKAGGLEKVLSVLAKEPYTYEEMSFSDYLEAVSDNPKKHLRTAFQHLRDAIFYFGYTMDTEFGQEVRRYTVFEDPFQNILARSNEPGPSRIIGNYRAREKLVRQIDAIADSGTNRILILQGPFGNGKTSTVRLLMRAMESYSTFDEGALYSIRWEIKPSDKGPLGFTGQRGENDSISMNCQFNDHPLYMIPKRHRLAVLNELVEDIESVPPAILAGDACHNCSDIRERMYEKLGGWEEVLERIKVRRMRMDELNRSGSATVEPIQNPDGQSAMVTMHSQAYAELMFEMPGVKISNMEGKWVHANRGIIHFSDIFKRHDMNLQHLLSAVEGFVDLNGIKAYSDTVIIGTTNWGEYERFRKDLITSGALSDRISMNSIEYLLNYKQEQKLHTKMLRRTGHTVSNKERHYNPIIPEITALWSVLTRLEKPEFGKRWDKVLEDHPEFESASHYLERSPLLKAKVLAQVYDEAFFQAIEVASDAPLYKRDELLNHLGTENFQEGRFGVSPRTIENTFGSLSQNDENRNCIGIASMLNWFKALESEDSGKVEHPFLQYLDRPDFRCTGNGYAELNAINKIVISEVDRQLRTIAVESLLGIADLEVETMFERYARHIAAKSKSEERVLHNGEYEEVSEPVMKKIETYMGVDDVAKARTGVLHKIALYMQESNSTHLGTRDYGSVFADQIGLIRNAMFKERIRNLEVTAEELKRGLQMYCTGRSDKVPEQQKSIIKSAIDTMQERHNFCGECAPQSLKYVLDKGLITF